MYLAKADRLLYQEAEFVGLRPDMLNRHGLIAGCTGSGKTFTLQKLAELFSDAGIPVFMADVKGDLAGMDIRKHTSNLRARERMNDLELASDFKSYPVGYWDVFGLGGLKLQPTISAFGHLLLSRMLELNPTQTGVCSIAFQLASDWNMPINSFSDLKEVLNYLTLGYKYDLKYGHVSTASAGIIQRAILELERQGAGEIFGKSVFDINDFFQLEDGRGVINLLSAERLIKSPKIYASLILWLLSETYNRLPEVGDLEKPKFVFFIDEAHLLFKDVPKSLLEKIEEIIRLIRSKGVGIFLITQNPNDIPDIVLDQLGNRVQHAMRAYTPKALRGLKTIAETFRPNPLMDTYKALTELAIGEALVSLLDKAGMPQPVRKVKIIPPNSVL